MSTMGRRIKDLRLKHGMTQEMLGNHLGVQKSAIRKYESGAVKNIPTASLAKIASVFDVTPSYIMGFDEYNTVKDENNINYNEYGLRPIVTKRFPMLGEIACGEPIFADEEHESYIDAAATIDADFCLTAKGDSMIDARIKNGDVVFIKKSPIVQNGEIAAVIIDGEATLKKWFYYPEKQKLVLNPANQSYEPLVYTGTELDTIVCLGKAVCFMSNL